LAKLRSRLAWAGIRMNQTFRQLLYVLRQHALRHHPLDHEVETSDDDVDAARLVVAQVADPVGDGAGRLLPLELDQLLLVDLVQSGLLDDRQLLGHQLRVEGEHEGEMLRWRRLVGRQICHLDHLPSVRHGRVRGRTGEVLFWSGGDGRQTWRRQLVLERRVALCSAS
jgi:hypothetical protein